MVLFSVKYLLSIPFLRVEVLLVSFEHSKSAGRFTAFSTAHVDSHELDGLMEVLTSLRLAFILESEYKVVLVTPIAILQLFKIQNSKFQKVANMCVGISWWWMVPVLAQGVGFSFPLSGEHNSSSPSHRFVGCTWSLAWLYQRSGHKCVSSPSVSNFFRLKVCYLPYGRREHCILWSCLGHITMFFLPTICLHLCSICRIFPQLPAIFQLKQCLIVKAF